MRLELLLEDSAPVWLCRLDATASQRRAPCTGVDIWHALPGLAGCEFRAVSAARFAHVVATGIDVRPSDSHFYCSDLDKAWEYGGWPKIVLALDQRMLARTCRVVEASLPTPELDALRERYPTVLPSQDGSHLWLSRLPADDPSIGKSYEAEYARWIPGDPREALLAVIVFADDDSDLDALAGVLARRDRCVPEDSTHR